MLKVFSLYLVIFFFGCRNKANNSEDTLVIDLTKKLDTISLKLDDFANDIKLIRLEANENSFIRYFWGYIGEKNIISIGNEKILQFSADGRFIRIIARRGRGPGEFGQIDAWDVDKNEQFFIFHDVGKNYINKYNLDSYMFEDNIPFINRGNLSNMLLINDTLISILPSMFSSYGYLYFYQSISGRIIEGKKMEPIPHPGIWAGKSPVFKKAADNSIFFQPSESDSIFNIVGSEIKPLISLLVEKPQKNGEITIGSYVSFTYLDKKRIFLQKSGYETHKTSFSVSTKTLSREYLFFDKSTNKIFKIDPFYLDYSGIKLKISSISFIRDNQFVMVFEALDFRVLLGDALKNNEIPESKKDRLKQLYTEISDNDNPILITGKCR